MRKTLLFISFIATIFVAKAQIEILYDGNVVTDTVIVNALSPTDESNLYFHCKNSGTDDITAKVFVTELNSVEGVLFMSICTPGTCKPGFESANFNVESGADVEFHTSLAIDPGIASGTTVLYALKVQDVNDETNSKTILVKYIITNVGVNALAKNTTEINLYPNPAKNMAYIDYDLSEYNVSSSKIEIRNMLGSVVKEVVISSKQGKQAVDVSNMPNGVYLCSIVCNGKVSKTKKMIVKH